MSQAGHCGQRGTASAVSQRYGRAGQLIKWHKAPQRDEREGHENAGSKRVGETGDSLESGAGCPAHYLTELHVSRNWAC